MLALLIALQTPQIDASTFAPQQAPITIAAADPAPADSASDIVVRAHHRHAVPGDPLAAANARSFAMTQSVDDAVTRPVALAYKHNIPEPVRDGLRNALKNLSEPVVFVNFVLQHKIGKAAETVGRFALNSTAGAGGLFDVARRKPFNLPRRPNGLAYTLGYYGVGPGPYLYLPLVGPTTVRDMIGSIADRMILPMGIGAPFTNIGFSAPVGAVAAVDRRAEFDDDLEAIRASGDAYTARKEFYLRKRQREIDALRGARPAQLVTPLFDRTPIGPFSTTPDAEAGA